MRNRARHEAPVFRVAGLDGLHRFLEGRALDRALDPAAVVGGRCDEQRCERYHAMLPRSMRAVGRWCPKTLEQTIRVPRITYDGQPIAMLFVWSLLWMVIRLI